MQNKLTITFKTPPLIGGYSPNRTGVDKSTARDKNGVPVIPASAIKGALREAFEQVARGIGEEICNANWSNERREKCTCLACQVFGGLEAQHDEQDREALLRIFDGYLIDSKIAALFEEDKQERISPEKFGYHTRYGVSISRKIRTAMEERLFTAETVDPSIPLEFEAEIDGLERLNEQQRKLFQAALRNVVVIGGGRSRGFGFCEISDAVPEKADATRLQQEEIKQQSNDAQQNNSPFDGIDSSARILLVAESPLCLSDTKPYGRFFPTKRYVPGGSLRGAFAAALIKAGIGPDTKAFKMLFLDDECMRFGNAYPAKGKQSSYLIPKSAATCKISPGFKNEGTVTEPEQHGVVDVVVPNLIYETGLTKGIPIIKKQICPDKECKSDLQPVPFSYYYRATKYDSHQATTRVVTRTALSRRLRTTHEEKLFSLETLPAGECFAGRIDGLIDEAKTLLASFHNGTLHIGADKSCGLGKVRIEFEKPDDVKGVEQRLFGFNQKVKAGFAALCSAFGKDDPSKDKIYFTLDLLSDMLLLNPETLEPYASLPQVRDEQGQINEIYRELFQDLNIRLQASYASSELVSGWNSAHKRPKEVRLAIEKGSVFLFEAQVNNLHFEDPDTVAFDEKEQLIELLEHLEQQGMGDLREEGFGWLQICDPFHYEMEVY